MKPIWAIALLTIITLVVLMILFPEKKPLEMTIELPDGWKGEGFRLESIGINYIAPAIKDSGSSEWLIFGQPYIELTDDTLIFKIPWKIE